MFFTTKQEINDYFYPEKGQTRFNDNDFRKDMEVKDDIKSFGNDFMVFIAGRWRHINEDNLLKIIKRNILKTQPDLTYTDTQFKRIIDVLSSKIGEFASSDEMYSAQTDGTFKVISENTIFRIRKDYQKDKIFISSEDNIGQLFNFVSAPEININVNDATQTNVISVGNDEIDQFLKDVTVNDPEMIRVFQEIAGYSMLNGHLEPFIYIGVGKGSNGKSVFASLLKNIVGIRNVSAIEFADLGPQTVASLEQNYINLPTELSGSRMLPENILKAITDGDPIGANEKYKEPRTIFPISKQFAMANELPPVKDATDGFWRRAIVIPFDMKITKGTATKKDKAYFENLFKNNSSALQLWAFRGLIRLIKNKGFHTKCKRIEVASKRYQQENNNVLNFVDDVTEIFINYFTQENMSKQEITLRIADTNIPVFVAGNGESSMVTDNMYKAYQNWSRDNGFKAQSLKNFRKKIEEKAGSDYFEFEFEIRKSSGKLKFFYTNDNELHELRKLRIEKELEETHKRMNPTLPISYEPEIVEVEKKESV